MEGPIPSVISLLTNLTDLYDTEQAAILVILIDCDYHHLNFYLLLIIRRITDLRGSGSKLPDLSGMKSLKTM